MNSAPGHVAGDPCTWVLAEHTEAKHRLYRHYLDAWWGIMLQARWRRVTYLDAFAGPGEYDGGEEGSPAMALRSLLEHGSRANMRLSPDRVTLIFLEKEARRVAHLRHLLETMFGPLADLPVTVMIEQGEAERDALRLLNQVGAWGQPILAIIDSWSNVGVPLSAIERIANNIASETIVTFGPTWFSRREDQDPEKLDAIFGGGQYWSLTPEEWSPERRREYWLETYRRALVRAGHTFPLGFQVVPATGQPLHLIFGTGSPKGVAEFKAAMWRVDRSDGMKFYDPRCQAGKREAFDEANPTLFDVLNEGKPDDELLDYIAQRLSQGPATVEEIGQYLLLETARWRVRDARPALTWLIEAGQVLRDPVVGQLTKATQVRLLE